MAFAKPLVLDYNGVGTKSLNHVLWDNYSSGYLLNGATDTFTAQIRNQYEARDKVTGLRMARHNVDLTRTVKAVGAVPAYTQQAYLVFRHPEFDDVVDASRIGEALSKLMVIARYQDLGAMLS